MIKKFTSNTKTFVFLLVLVMPAFPGMANITLPAVFSDNMVLQQNSEVAIWGWSNPSETVKIVGSWQDSDTVVATAQNDAFWTSKIKTAKAGGPYTLTIIGSSTVELKNVMLGEVWICSGQSNMEWSVNHGIDQGEEEATNAHYQQIRIFHVPKIGADDPQDDCKATWTACTPETMRSTSAIGYFFGRELHQQLDVPVGLIVSAWGGTPAEVWTRREVIENDPVLKASSDEAQEFPNWPTRPGIAYNGMIAPLLPYGIAGAIWYQGESNVSRASTYDQVFIKLIENWRADFGKQFPFYYVQIAPYTYGPKENAAFLREQQAKALGMPNTGMVVVSDLVDDTTNIHPKNKQDVGKRLANWALSETYGKDMGSYKSPMYQSMKVEKNKIRVTFENADNGLVSKDKTITHFQIAGEDRNFVNATAKINGNSVLVYHKSVKKPVAVRYCFDNSATPNLFSKEGLPVAPFRTDQWDAEYNDDNDK